MLIKYARHTLIPIIISQVRDRLSSELLFYHADDPVPSAPEMTRITGRSLTEELHTNSTYRLAIVRRLKTPLSPQKAALIQDFVALNNGAIIPEQQRPSCVLMASSSPTTQAFEHLDCSDFVMMMLHLVGLVEPTQNPFEYVASDSRGRLLAAPITIKLKSNSTTTTTSTINSTTGNSTTISTTIFTSAQTEQQQQAYGHQPAVSACSDCTSRFSILNASMIDGNFSLSPATNGNTRKITGGDYSNDDSSTSPTSVVAHSHRLKSSLDETSNIKSQDTHRSAPTTPTKTQYTHHRAATVPG